MTSVEDTIVFMAFLGLLGVPVLATIQTAIVKRCPPKVRNAIYQAALVMVLIVGFCVLGKIDFSSVLYSGAFLLLSYACYGFLAVSCLRAGMWIIGSILCLPLILGVLAGTIGCLGVFFIAGDAAQSPQKQTLKNGLVCETKGWGGAWGDSGEVTAIYQPLPLGLRRQIGIRWTNDTASVVSITGTAVKQCAN